MKRREPTALVARHVKLISAIKAAGQDPHPCLQCDRCEMQFFPGTHVASVAIEKFAKFLKDHSRCEFR